MAREIEIKTHAEESLDGDFHHDAEKGAALGGLGGAVVGAAAGSIAGPVGTVLGAVAGGLLGAGASGLAVGAIEDYEAGDSVTVEVPDRTSAELAGNPVVTEDIYDVDAYGLRESEGLTDETRGVHPEHPTTSEGHPASVLTPRQVPNDDTEYSSFDAEFGTRPDDRRAN